VWAPRATALAWALLAARPALGQSSGDDDSIAQTLAVFGLSVGLVVGVVATLVVLHVAAIFAGTRAAGLAGGLGKPCLVLLVTAFLLVPFLIVQRAFELAANQSVMAVVSSAGYLGAETLAIKWIYGAPWGRALLAYFVTATLFSIATAVVLLSVF
jgi:hypothetical protein